jgi:hypothetical protein
MNTLPTSLVKHTLFLAMLAMLPLQAEDSAKMPPLGMATALKLGVDGLVPKYAEDSEEGRDSAAGMYAAAKRLETDYALGQRDLDLVLVLNDWRVLVQECRQDYFVLQEIEAGGGSIYLHAMARDIARIEDFLATFSKRLPLAEGKGDAKTTAAIKTRIAEIKKTKLEADADKEAKASLAETIEEQVTRLGELLVMLEAMPAEDAKNIGAFILSAQKALE